MSKNGLRIDILGTDLTISADEDPAYLNALLEKYRLTVENIQRRTGIKDPLKTAVLTGFLLCDDLEKARASGGSGSPAQGLREKPGEAEAITLGMISRLDEIVPGKEASADGSGGAAFTGAVDDTENSAAIAEAPPPREAALDAPTGVSTVPPGGADTRLFKLQNTVKNYDWGSTEWLPAFLGQRNISRIPWAEFWLGVHPAGPSRVAFSGGAENGPLLSELISRDAETFLGAETAKKYGTLPFLFKVLAAAKPLSIQAHPSLARAKEGFEKENLKGIPLNAPNRNYKDPNHKPEIICALSPFAALSGFRAAGEISAFMEILSVCAEGYAEESGPDSDAFTDGLEKLSSALKREGGNPLEGFIAALYTLEKEALKSLGFFIKSRLASLKEDFPEYKDEWDLCAYLSRLYPGDPGIIAPLFLNIIELKPGEAIYLPAGIFHAYIQGMGIELMANSDNVLRGGLTAKHVDPEELSRTLEFSEYRPEIMKVPTPLPIWYTYPSPAGEFSLSVMHGSENAVPYPEAGPSIVLVTEGSAVLKVTGCCAHHGCAPHGGGGAELVLEKGESVFIPAGKNTDTVFSGNFTAYIASC